MKDIETEAYDLGRRGGDDGQSLDLIHRRHSSPFQLSAQFWLSDTPYFKAERQCRIMGSTKNWESI